MRGRWLPVIVALSAFACGSSDSSSADTQSNDVNAQADGGSAFSDAATAQAETKIDPVTGLPIPIPTNGDAGFPEEPPYVPPMGGPGPVEMGTGEVRACTGPKASGVAILCVRAGDAARIATIGAAVSSAKDGDIIQVAAGTYAEDVSIQGKSLSLLGGYDSGFTARNVSGNVTKIQGSGSSSVVRVLASGKTVMLDGFTITGGVGSASEARSGAGIYSSGGTTTYSNNRITKNKPALGTIHMTDTRGGGIVANGEPSDSTRIAQNVIDDNVSGRGAGIASSGLGKVVIENNVISNNRGYSDHGGGLFVNSRNITISGNLVEKNEIGPTTNPYGYGGGIYIHDPTSYAKLSYNVVTKNVAVTVASGVFIDNGAHAALSHELIYGNKCTQAGGSAITVDSTDGAPIFGSIVTIDKSTVTGHDCPTQNHGDGILIGGTMSTATVTGSIFWNNGPTQFNYGRTAEGPPVVSASWTAADPMFVDPAASDFHLKAGSPAAGFGAL